MADNKQATGQEAQAFDFEEALDQLEALVSAMEEGELSLEESLRAFETGVKLTRECQNALDKAEQKVQTLLDDAGTTEPLEFDDDQDDEN
ncbi:MAG: exodeoxyribonuclease VII small subunit [Gammaproteobacteria bacterium]|nr:exodeoxyribonuclease VII small subunit [Pseudomonadales bacterium]MCP5348667.1 exodeoxyribonuclease VII small subunit [Pseudomonadales bacterium]